MNQIKDMVNRYKSGNIEGVFSVCCSNSYVIEAAMTRILEKDMPLVVEATANQVDQFGGYTGMTPKDYVNYIYELADKVSFPKERIILGGDHLGPLTWKNIDSGEAMNNAKKLIKEYVLAGFTKIHIDTSMPLLGDIEGSVFGDDLISYRATELCKVAEMAYLNLKKDNENAIHPVYIIGSEVPIPGGAQEEEEGPTVTKIGDFKRTIETFKNTFYAFGLEEAFRYVVGIVVQPGVEFGSSDIWDYNREEARNLSNALKDYPNLVFEAHSTDYQTPKALRQMVEDGFAILKVGPAFTYGFREAVFALNHIENEMFKSDSNIELSNFIDILDSSMEKEPKDWINHYIGTESKIRLERKYSLSDRARYYMPKEEVNLALEKLINNLSNIEIPITLISQFMHEQYKKVRNGELSANVEELLKDRICEYIDDYIYAIDGKVS